MVHRLATSLSSFAFAALIVSPVSAQTVQLISSTFFTGEGAVNGTVGVNRSGPLTGTSTVHYSTSDGTAIAGLDYTATSGTLTFGPGVAALSFNIPITQDSINEPTEFFNVTLDSPTGATLGTPSTGTFGILDDDPPPSISIANVSQAEGNSGTTTFTFTASLSAMSGFPISFDYATADGTATAPSDYTAVGSTTLTIPAGAAGGTFNINVVGDTAVEPDETFVVNFSNPVHATLATTQATGTIVNDDAALVASANLSLQKTSSAPTFHGGDTITYTLTASNAGPDPATNVVVTDVLPAGTTYVSATPSAGSCSGTLTVTCTLGTLANGATATVALMVTVNGASPITNSASVTATETDANPANNTAAATIDPSAPSIPALSPWMLAALVLALSLAALRNLQ